MATPSAAPTNSQTRPLNVYRSGASVAPEVPGAFAPAVDPRIGHPGLELPLELVTVRRLERAGRRVEPAGRRLGPIGRRVEPVGRVGGHDRDLAGPIQLVQLILGIAVAEVD